MTTRSIFLPEPIAAYMAAIAQPEHPALAELRAETARLPQAHYQIAPEEGRLLQILATLMSARAVLEIGTFTGYSALALALVLPADGRIVTLDISEEFTAIARRHWQAAGMEGRIELRLGPALAELDTLAAEAPITGGAFDLAFIDADKERYDAYYERCLRLVRPGGAIVVDNTLWRGRVADPEDRRAKTRAFRAFNAKLQSDDRVLATLLPIGDGVTLAALPEARSE